MGEVTGERAANPASAVLDYISTFVRGALLDAL